MTTNVAATYQNGKVVLKQDVDWEDGVELEITPKLVSSKDHALCGDGSQWPANSEELAEFLSQLDSLQPVMDEESASQLDRTLQQRKRAGKLEFAKRSLRFKPIHPMLESAISLRIRTGDK